VNRVVAGKLRRYRFNCRTGLLLVLCVSAVESTGCRLVSRVRIWDLTSSGFFFGCFVTLWGEAPTELDWTFHPHETR